MNIVRMAVNIPTHGNEYVLAGLEYSDAKSKMNDHIHQVIQWAESTLQEGELVVTEEVIEDAHLVEILHNGTILMRGAIYPDQPITFPN